MRTNNKRREEQEWNVRYGYVGVGIAFLVATFALMALGGPAFSGFLGVGVVFLVLGFGKFVEKDRP